MYVNINIIVININKSRRHFISKQLFSFANAEICNNLFYIYHKFVYIQMYVFKQNSGIELQFHFCDIIFDFY